MTIRFHKDRSGRHTLIFTRDDGSICRFKGDDFFIRHDLVHHAIETTLGLRQAFYGLIASGIDVADFEDRSTRDRMDLKEEAWHAETLANLFLIDHTQGPFEDLPAIYASTLNSTHPGLHPLPLDVDRVASIRKAIGSSLETWKKLPDGGDMELSF